MNAMGQGALKMDSRQGLILRRYTHVSIRYLCTGKALVASQHYLSTVNKAVGMAYIMLTLLHIW